MPRVSFVLRLLGFERASAVTRATVDGFIARRRAEGEATREKLGHGVADATIDHETEVLRRALRLGQEDGKVAFVPKVTRLVRGHAKTGRGRVIALDGWRELAEVIERRLGERRLDSPLIFHNGRGGKVGDFYTTWARAIERAKVVPFTLHDFRRTAVRNMVRAGIDRTIAKAISGHKTDSMFERYNITSERDLAEAGDKRTAYEEQRKAKGGAAETREPATLPFARPAPHR